MHVKKAKAGQCCDTCGIIAWGTDEHWYHGALGDHCDECWDKDWKESENADNNAS
jgi:hypothetical protein